MKNTELEFSLAVELENAAFFDGEGEFVTSTFALQRILREVADRIGTGEQAGKVRDDNGNTVGNFSIEGGEA